MDGQVNQDINWCHSSEMSVGKACIIEDIGTLGINAFKNIVDLNKCQCE